MTGKPSRLVPKLRFPEFRDAPGWSAPRFSDLYGFKRTNTLSRDKLNYESGTIRNIHYGDIHTKFKPLFRVGDEHVPYVNPDVLTNGLDDDAFCEEGDIVLADASEDIDDIGKAIEVVSLDGQRTVAGTHTILATRRGSIPVIGFGGQLLQSAAVRTGIKREAQGAKVYGISANRISAVRVPVPPTPAEQQKIADCLGSLDDLITAEGRKLDALRRHKSGLMQQLFPRPGETTPRLRFPEFREAGDWEEVTLGRIGEFIGGGTPSTSIPEYWGGDIQWFTPSEINQRKLSKSKRTITCEGLKHSSAKLLPTGALLITTRATIGDVGIADDPCATNQGFQSLVVFGYEVNVFWYYWLVRHKHELIRRSSGSTFLEIGKTELKQILTVRPDPAEQNRIAACLGSLDDLIAAEARQLDALRRHKQGLMQQLFPSGEERKG